MAYMVWEIRKTGQAPQHIGNVDSLISGGADLKPVLEGAQAKGHASGYTVAAFYMTQGVIRLFKDRERYDEYTQRLGAEHAIAFFAHSEG